MSRQIAFVASVLMLISLGGTVPLAMADEPVKAVVIPGGKPCQGTLQIRGKSYNLDRAVAYTSIVLNEECVNVLLSSSTIPIDKLKTAILDGNGADDKFFFFQPNVKITFSKEGKARFFNAYGDGGSVSAAGSDLKGQLAIKDGRGSGSCSYIPDEKKNGFDVQYDLAVLPIPQAVFAKIEAEKAERLAKRAQKEKERKAKKEADAAKAAVAEATGPKAHSLPIPQGATNVEFQKQTGQIRFQCPSDVVSTANFFVQQLAAQGWTAGKDLIRAKSSIMKRTKGDASLSIFVRPADGATSVQIIAKGLSWDEAKPAVGK